MNSQPTPIILLNYILDKLKILTHVRLYFSFQSALAGQSLSHVQY